MTKITHYKQLQVWQLGMQLMKFTYQITNLLPKSEEYGLKSQMRRASTGVVANIAEGFGRQGIDDKKYKYIIARGECIELETLLIASQELAFYDKKTIEPGLQLTSEIGKCINGLIRRYSLK